MHRFERRSQTAKPRSRGVTRSWGWSSVRVYPFVAVAAAVGLVVSAGSSAQPARSAATGVIGSGGATLVAAGTSGRSGVSPAYRDVSFATASRRPVAIQGSTSLAIPPYSGWEANGSAGGANAVASVSGGRLRVAVVHRAARYWGWFLTATAPTPAACVFNFAAGSPPAVTVPGAHGELVMAVQTSDTIVTGDIDYVVVAENVDAGGARHLVVGYSLGHLARAQEHLLKSVAWQPGPLQVAISTNGTNRLEVWVNGQIFYRSTSLDMGIVAPFEPYLEVQAQGTPYTVSFSGYSSVCRPDVVVDNLPTGSVVSLGSQSAVAEGGHATLPLPETSGPVSGRLEVRKPGQRAPVVFAPHTYWPGDRYTYRSARLSRS